MKNTKPHTEALMIEDMVTATLLTNLAALLQYGPTLQESMFLHKTNWRFIAKALDLQSSNRFDVPALLQALEEDAEIKNPYEVYGKLLASLKGGRNFSQAYPRWLNDARKRYVSRKEAEMPMTGEHAYTDMAEQRTNIYMEAARLGGLILSVQPSKAV